MTKVYFLKTKVGSGEPVSGKKDIWNDILTPKGKAKIIQYLKQYDSHQTQAIKHLGVDNYIKKCHELFNIIPMTTSMIGGGDSDDDDEEEFPKKKPVKKKPIIKEPEIEELLFDRDDFELDDGVEKLLEFENKKFEGLSQEEISEKYKENASKENIDTLEKLKDSFEKLFDGDYTYLDPKDDLVSQLSNIHVLDDYSNADLAEKRWNFFKKTNEFYFRNKTYKKDGKDVRMSDAPYTVAPKYWDYAFFNEYSSKYPVLDMVNELNDDEAMRQAVESYKKSSLLKYFGVCKNYYKDLTPSVKVWNQQLGKYETSHYTMSREANIESANPAIFNIPSEVSGMPVDFIFETPNNLFLCEIKGSSTSSWTEDGFGLCKVDKDKLESMTHIANTYKEKYPEGNVVASVMWSEQNETPVKGYYVPIKTWYRYNIPLKQKLGLPHGKFRYESFGNIKTSKTDDDAPVSFFAKKETAYPELKNGCYTFKKEKLDKISVDKILKKNIKKNDIIKKTPEKRIPDIPNPNRNLQRLEYIAGPMGIPLGKEGKETTKNYSERLEGVIRENIGDDEFEEAIEYAMLNGRGKKKRPLKK